MKDKIPHFIKKKFSLKNFPKSKFNLLTLFLFLLGFAFLLLICWFLLILSEVAWWALLSALLLNIFYFLVAYDYINELVNEKKVKQDFDKDTINGEKILWKLEKRLRFSSIFVYVYSGGRLGFIILSIFNSLNLKAMYLSENNLFIEKYFGEDLKLALGSFYVAEKKDLLDMVFEVVINSIHNHSIFYIFMNPDTNITALKALIKPYLRDYLINASAIEYRLFKILAKTQYNYDVNFAELDKLRGEKDSDDLDEKIAKTL